MAFAYTVLGDQQVADHTRETIGQMEVKHHGLGLELAVQEAVLPTVKGAAHKTTAETIAKLRKERGQLARAIVVLRRVHAEELAALPPEPEHDADADEDAGSDDGPGEHLASVEVDDDAPSVPAVTPDQVATGVIEDARRIPPGTQFRRGVRIGETEEAST